uniref:RRM domain-containing protein n=1 Tax=Strongyloides stercoralis TaxID=6248 RepID=A0A0K0DU40_STRER
MKLICKLLNQVASTSNSTGKAILLRKIPWFSGSKEIKDALKDYGYVEKVILFENSSFVTHSENALVVFENKDSAKNLLKNKKIKVDGFDVSVHEYKNDKKQK